jgi:hypothetical protein
MAVVESIWSETAAWVEAVGAIAAVVGAGWVAAGESRAARRREERARDDAERKEARSLLATKTAALNLSILAATQIHDLHILLRDEAWRGRVARVSPSRTLLATERMLTTFPIQSLGDAPAMVEFSRFPAALATAAEVYANLETAVRAAADAERGAIFIEYTAQMERVDTRAQRGLRDLRTTLGFPDEGSDITADKMTEHEAETSHGIVTRVLTHGIDVTAG